MFNLNTMIVPEQFVDPTNGQLYTLIPSSSPPTVGGTVRVANAIVLPNGVATDNYYIGYDVILEKALSNGKTYTQKKRISAYKGSTKTAIIDDVWDVGYEPAIGDAYRLVLSYPDMRVTINPPMQILDYITSIRYGRGLDVENDILLDTWKNSAVRCDAKSDVSLKSIVDSTVAAGAVYRLTEGSRIVWEGTARTNGSGKYTNFTGVLGKITNRWNSWKSWVVGDILYTDQNRFYKVTTAGPKATNPVHTTGTTNGLLFISTLAVTKISGTGPVTLGLNISTNPVLGVNSKNEEVSGYSLYDADSIDFWRRLGWDEHSQASATLYQTNHTLDTSAPLFDNINMMLEHVNGIFSYSEGKYALDIEGIESTATEITEGDIIGKISFEDSGNKSSYNSVTVSYFDPGNNFESRNLSLFSDKFLKQDRNVPKKGNITISGTTNYYNVRLLADSYLKRSRFNSTIRVTLFPEFMTLVPGAVISFTHPRYNWIGKRFRVDTFTMNPNGTVTVVANEYQDSFYALTNMNKTASVGTRGASSMTVPSAPTNMTATSSTDSNQIFDGIQLSWTNPDTLSTSTLIEILESDTALEEITIISSSANVVTTSVAHGLKEGSTFIVNTAGSGLLKGYTYFVKTVPSATTMTLATYPGGPVVTVTNGTGKSIKINPFTLAGTVAYPESSFLHTFAGITQNTTKFYKARYKVQK